MSLDMTSFDAALKTLYTKEKVENLVYPDHPFLALVPKDEGFVGANKVVPVIYGNPQGRSATFSTAVSNKGNSSLTKFTITRKKDYSLASIDNETLEASEGNEGALIEAAETEIDGALQSASRSLSTSLFRDGSGAIGQIANSSMSDTTITLSDPNDVLNFEVGMVIQSATTKTGGSGTINNNTVTVSYVNRTATSAQIGIGGVAISTMTGAAQSDYLYVQGDYDGKITGLAGWLPTTDPSPAENFFGVDRSIDRTRLAGIHHDGTSVSLREAIVDAAQIVAREGGRPSHLFCSFEKFGDLLKELDIQTVRDVVKMGAFSFSSVVIHGPKGDIKVVPDSDCPNNRMYLLQLNTWKLESLGAAPKILKTDGLMLLREANSDAVEVRSGYYAQLSCKAPGYNCVISVAA